MGNLVPVLTDPIEVRGICCREPGRYCVVLTATGKDAIQMRVHAASGRLTWNTNQLPVSSFGSSAQVYIGRRVLSCEATFNIQDFTPLYDAGRMSLHVDSITIEKERKVLLTADFHQLSFDSRAHRLNVEFEASVV